jgi:hypothetical protein
VRRVFGAVALALGVTLLVLGAVSRPLIYDKLAVVSLDQRSTSVSEGQNMSALRVWSDEQGTSHFDQLTDATIRSTRQVVGIPGAVPEAERDGTAVWQTGVTSEAVGVGSLTYSQELVTFDRRSGLTTGAARDERSAGDLDDPSKMVPVTHEGLFFKFPFAVEKKTYPWWDGDLSQAVDISFVKEEEIDGVNTYVFQQVIPQTEVPPARTVPAAVFGATGADVQATVSYGNTRTLWVEPNTGVIIKGQEQVDKSLISTLGTVATTKGTIGYSDQTVRDNAETWGTKGRLLGFIGGPFLWVGIVSGLLLIVLGAVLIGRRPASTLPDGEGTDGTDGADDVAGVEGLGLGGDGTRREPAGA